MSRLVVLGLAACGIIALYCSYAAASEAEEKAQKTFDTLYGEDFRRAAASRDTAQAVALAAKLLDAAKSAETQPELMALLCAKACELGAMDVKGYETAGAAAALAEMTTPELAGPCQDKIATIRQKQYDKARPEEKDAAGDALVDALVASAATKRRAGDVEEADKRLRKALAVARAVKSPKTDGVELQVRAIAERQKAAVLAAQLKVQVQADPANAKARDQLVRLLVVDLDDPAEAAKYLDETSEAALRRFVPAAARPVAEMPDMGCLELADGYLQFASAAGLAGKMAAYARVKSYAERFLRLHEARDIDRTRMELALKKADAELAKFGGGARKKINVALLTGGRLYTSAPAALMNVFDGPGISVTAMRQQVGGEVFDSIDDWKYDVVVFYNVYQKITERQQQNLLKLADKGVGLVILHHACEAYNEWPEFLKIVGATFTGTTSTKADVKYRVRVADPKHPITAGLSDYELTDETFAGVQVDPLNHILLTTVEPSSMKTIAWTRTYRNSRVFYIQNGHDAGAFMNPTYKVLVQRGIRWVAGQL